MNKATPILKSSFRAGFLLVFSCAALLIAIVTHPILLLIRCRKWISKAIHYVRTQEPGEGAKPIDEGVLKSPSIIAILVHGTFDTGAEWCNEGGTIHSILAKGRDSAGKELSWHTHPWTGKNTVSARLSAIESLRKQLDQVLRQQENRRIILIGHSHGGNIAIKVAESFPNANLQVITLATPFLTVQRRPLQKEFILYLIALFAIEISAIAGICAGVVATDYGTSPPLFIGIAAALVTFTACVWIGFPEALKQLECDESELLASSADPEKVDSLVSRTLVCSRTGDEADASLKIATFLANFVARNMHQSHSQDKAEDDIELITNKYSWGQLSRKDIICGAAKHACSMSSVFKMAKGIIDIVVLLCGTLVLELLMPAIGTRGNLVKVTMMIASSETPPGHWLHYQSSRSVNAGSSILSHTQICNDSTLFEQISDWIGDM